MSLQALEEIKCPCGERFETEIYQSVSVAEDPELKDLILGGEFNMVECPNCHEIIYAERVVLYHDREQQLLAFVYPDLMRDKKEVVAAEIKSTYDSLQKALPEGESLKYQPLPLFGMDELCHVLNEDDEMADEAEIASYLSKSLGLKIRKLDKDIARKRKIPPILPHKDAGGDLRKALIEGLETLLKENDRLVHYKKFLTQVKADPAWSL